MATGDLIDMLARIKSVLPSKWFADGQQINAIQNNITLNGQILTDYQGNPILGNTITTVTPTLTPVLDGFLSGPSYVWSWVFSFLDWVASQTRIATASGLLLDLIALDFFGSYIKRRAGEPDISLRSRIKAELLRPKGTRAAVISAVTALTGRAPTVFEPAYAHDTGGIGHLGMMVGTGLAIAGVGSAGAGGWGSLLLPFQFFIVAPRATVGGIPSVVGYYTGSGWAGGGIGSVSDGGRSAGAIEVASLDMTQGQITDQDIYNVINKTRPAGTIAWTALT